MSKKLLPFLLVFLLIASVCNASSTGIFSQGVSTSGGSGSGTVTSVGTGNGLTGGPITTTGTINLSVPNATKSADYTLAAADMAGTVNLTGTHTLTIPAISGTVFASGMSSCYSNIGTGTWTISTTPTINGMTGTSIPPGGAGCWVSNGTTLDYQPGIQPATSSKMGGVICGSGTTCTSGTISVSGGAGTVTSVTFTGDGTVLSSTPSSAVTTSGTLTATLATQTANTVLGAATSTTLTGLAVPSCSAASSALTWTTGTGFGCNTISGGTVNLGASTAAANPQISGDATTGLYTPGAAQVAVVVSGTQRALWNASGESITGTQIITSTSATALTVGGSGATTPALTVSGAATGTGFLITPAASGSGARLAVTSGNSNDNLFLDAKGTGTMTIGGTSTGLITMGRSVTLSNAANFVMGAGTFNIQDAASNTASTQRVRIRNATDLLLTAATSAPFFSLEMNAGVRTHASNTTIATQPDAQVFGTTHAFQSATGNITDLATLQITPSNTGTNATATNMHGIYMPTASVSANITNAYMLDVAATSGATNNFAARFDGSVVLLNAPADTASTDETLCRDTTSGIIKRGTGTIGICLGSSSLRYKEKVKPMIDGLAQITALKPVNFFYKKGRGDNGAKEQYGFIAEDVVKVLPVLTGLDKDGKPNSVDLMGMLPILVKAIQEQQKEIDALKAKK